MGQEDAMSDEQSGLDFTALIETRDRSASFPLLKRLLSPEFSSERNWCYGILVRTLQEFDDPRLVVPLTRLLRDPGQVAEKRLSASEILRGMRNAQCDGDAQVRSDWNSGDPVLRRHAMRSMGRDHRDLVAPVLGDPEHPLYADAIHCLTADSLSWAAAHLIRAARCPDAVTRNSATTLLLWFAPVVAEAPLLAATEDEDPAIVADALDALRSYPTRAVVRCADALRCHSSEAVRTAAEYVLGDIRDAVRGSADDLSRRSTCRVSKWLAPIAPLLRLPVTPAEVRRASVRGHDVVADARAAGGRRAEQTWLKSAAEMKRRFESLDAPAAERAYELSGADWSSLPDHDRAEAAEFLIGHPDDEVRYFAARPLAEWGDDTRLRILLDDPSRNVRRGALHHLRDRGPDPVLAERMIALATSADSHEAIDALEAAVGVGTPAQWRSFARDCILGPHVGEGLRVEALSRLVAAREIEIVRSALQIIEEPPVVSWALHIALIEAAVESDLPAPSTARFDRTDHFRLQRALQALDDAS